MTDTKAILEILSKDFPDAKSELHFNSPYELIVAVILSAQCTDKRVNLVTPALFNEAPTVDKLAAIPTERLEMLIRSCGFYHTKAAHLKQMAHDVVERFGGNIPDNLDDLQTLAGVGRKTANVVYAVGFGGQAIAVDTHVFRVSNRLGIASADNVLDTEKQLMQVIPREQWADSHHYILLQSYCKYYEEHHAEH